MRVLGIETSCDDSSASVVESEDGSLNVLSLATYSQAKIHQPYGGVVPEIASRNHLITINPMIEKALGDAQVSRDEIDSIAVTNRPGLVGALLVGVSAAKSLAYAWDRPLYPVHHLEGHALSLYLDQGESTERIEYPLLLAIVSGGHTNLYRVSGEPKRWKEGWLRTEKVARTLDDAAGEAFDKTAKLMGFPYPGGVFIDRHAEGGDPQAFELPRPLPQKKNLNFSFSGLKTAASLLIKDLKQKGEFEEKKRDLAASIQEAIVDQLCSKIFRAADHYRCRSIGIVGGVAANRCLRERLSERKGLPVFSPLMKYCTDNAAMVAGVGAIRAHQGVDLPRKEMLRLNAVANPH